MAAAPFCSRFKNYKNSVGVHLTAKNILSDHKILHHHQGGQGGGGGARSKTQEY